jgi:hypothetical protein
MRARTTFTSRASALALAATSLGALSACSKPEPASSARAPAAESTEAPLEELPELTAVPAPDNLVGLATLRTPARTLDTALGWTGLGVDFRTLLQAGPAAALLPVLDLDAPIDAVVTLDPQAKTRPHFYYAAAIGLTSRQAALDVLEGLQLPIELVEPGVHSVRPSPKTLCFVGPALGQAKARLVCGQDRESLDLLSPYLTRGNPSASTGDADLHIELRADAPWRQFGDKAQLLQLAVPMFLGEVSIGDPEFDGALRDGATARVDEVIATLGELSRVTLDARLRVDQSAPERQELEASLGLELRGSSSWFARALIDAESHASVAPDTFWKLPGDATQAAYSASRNPELFARANDVLSRLFESGLAHLGASRGVQQTWPSALRAALEMQGPMISARGAIPKEALAEKRDAREELRADLGYTIIGIDDPDRRASALLTQTLELYQDGPLRKSLAQKYALEVSKLPKVQSKKGPVRLAESKSYEIALPAAFFSEALEGSGVDPATLPPIPLVIVTSREGSMSWFGVSSYGSVLEQKLGALAAASPSQTLGGRTGLERLRSDRANAAGFWTLAGLAASPSFDKGELATFLAPLSDNQVPIVARVLGRASGPSSAMEVHVPAQLFRDIALAAATRK